MSTISNDYIGLHLYESRQKEIQKEIERLQRVREALKSKAVRPRFRLPKITIHWN